MLWHLPLMPMSLMFWWPPLKPMARWLRAADLAKITCLLAAGCLAFSGWIAPLFRQQYLVSLNLSDFVVSSVHQWTCSTSCSRKRSQRRPRSARRGGVALCG